MSKHNHNHKHEEPETITEQGTGRHSIALVKEGMNVTAVELVDKNWKIR